MLIPRQKGAPGQDEFGVTIFAYPQGAGPRQSQNPALNLDLGVNQFSNLGLNNLSLLESGQESNFKDKHKSKMFCSYRKHNRCKVKSLSKTLMKELDSGTQKNHLALLAFLHLSLLHGNRKERRKGEEEESLIGSLATYSI